MLEKNQIRYMRFRCTGVYGCPKLLDMLQFVNIGEVKIVPTKLADISPLCRHKIRGEWNCLFRTISKFVLGTERDHIDVRHGIVHYMELPSNIFEFECLFEFGTGLRYKSLHDYINETKMNLSSTYGTDFEIIAFATMVQSNVMVYMCADHTWRRCEPVVLSWRIATNLIYFLFFILCFEESLVVIAIQIAPSSCCSCVNKNL